MFSFLALTFAFFAKINIVRSTCNYHELLLGLPLAIAPNCFSFGDMTSFNSTCVNSTTVELSTYGSADCSGAVTKTNYSGDSVHCGGETCYAIIKSGTTCADVADVLYLPFDTCLTLANVTLQVTCSSFANYSSPTCDSAPTIAYSLDTCHTEDDGNITYITDGSGYCTSTPSTTSSTPATTSLNPATTTSSHPVTTSSHPATTTSSHPVTTSSHPATTSLHPATTASMGNGLNINIFGAIIGMLFIYLFYF